jgi:hypothetical protein
MSDIDVIAAAISGDRKAVLQEQLASIDRERIERLAINITTREAIHELLADLRHDILRLEPHSGEADEAMRAHERFALKEEFRRLVLRLSDEQRDCWNDKQALQAEARQLLQQLTTLDRRDRRLTEFT